MAEGHVPLWDAQVDVFAPTDALLSTWLDHEALQMEPGVVEMHGYGYNQDEDDGAHVDVRLWLRARDEDAARSIAMRVVEQECARADLALFADPRLEVAISLQPLAESALDNSEPEAGWEPERFEPATWDRYRPTLDDRALRIESSGFPLDIGRVEVDEQPERVTVTVYDRYEGFMREAGVEYGVAAVSVERRVLVPLGAPLGGRPVFDGTLGFWASERRPSNAANHGRRQLAAESDMEGRKFQTLEKGGGQAPNW